MSCKSMAGHVATIAFLIGKVLVVATAYNVLVPVYHCSCCRHPLMELEGLVKTGAKGLGLQAAKQIKALSFSRPHWR